MATPAVGTENIKKKIQKKAKIELAPKGAFCLLLCVCACCCLWCLLSVLFRGMDPRDRDGGRDRDRDGRRRGGDRYETARVFCAVQALWWLTMEGLFVCGTVQALYGLFDVARATLRTLRSPQTSPVL